MNSKEDHLEGWEFKIDEISANVYKVRGVDKAGRSVESTGTDPELLLSECKALVVKLYGKSVVS